MLIRSIPNSWQPILAEEINQTYFQKLQYFLNEARRTETIFPAAADVFSAFELTTYEINKKISDSIIIFKTCNPNSQLTKILGSINN